MNHKVIKFPVMKSFNFSGKNLQISCDNLIRAIKMQESDIQNEIVHYITSIDREVVEKIVLSFTDRQSEVIEQLKELPPRLREQPTNDFLYLLCKLFNIELHQAVNIYLKFKPMD